MAGSNNQSFLFGNNNDRTRVDYAVVGTKSPMANGTFPANSPSSSTSPLSAISPFSAATSPLVPVTFSPAERHVHDVIVRQSRDDAEILKLLEEMPEEKLETLAGKEDARGRTLLVNAIWGNYQSVVRMLLVIH